MDDLISRQAAILAIEEYADRLQMVNWKENPGVPYKAYALNWAINTLRDLPSAPTIDPVTHGRWTWDYNEAAYFCSICNHYGSGKFCPNCGAKMDEEEE